MWRWLYQGLLVMLWPWVHLRLRWRARREPAYGERIGERFGDVPASVTAGAIWFHTVSAGETIAAAPFVARLADDYPDQALLVTTMTPTGSAQVTARLGGRVDHCYAPYDFPWAVRRFFERVRPRLLVLMETELWPNLIDQAARRGVPVLLVNARLSERSARGYGHLGALTRGMLAQLRLVACQYPDHARRFEALGVPAARLLVLGSVKFDQTLPADHEVRVRALAERFALPAEPFAPVWIAASTHPGEETLALAAHQDLRRHWPQARLILVPRHPTRADEVAKLVTERGFAVARQSRPGPADRAAAVILGDTMGELLYLYGLARLAFVGGSFGRGGHNPIEPALCGVPVVMGPDVFNFTDVVVAFEDAGCLWRVGDGPGLSRAVVRAFDDGVGLSRHGARAAAVVAEHTGASARLIELLSAQIRAVVPPLEAPPVPLPTAHGATIGNNPAGESIR